MASTSGSIVKSVASSKPASAISQQNANMASVMTEAETAGVEPQRIKKSQSVAVVSTSDNTSGAVGSEASPPGSVTGSKLNAKRQNQEKKSGSSRPGSAAGSAVGLRSPNRENNRGVPRPNTVAGSAVGLRPPSRNPQSGISRPDSIVGSAVGLQPPNRDPQSGTSRPGSIVGSAVGLRSPNRENNRGASRPNTVAGFAVGLRLPPNNETQSGASRPATVVGSTVGLRPPSRDPQSGTSRPGSVVGSAVGLRPSNRDVSPPATVVGPIIGASAITDAGVQPKEFCSQLSTSPSQKTGSLKLHRKESANEDFTDGAMGISEKYIDATEDDYAMEDDFFAPIGERVQNIDFSRMRSQSIQISKNQQKKKASVLESLRKQVKHFFHEDRAGQLTDEHGNVELPMDPYVQARDDHDSGLLPHQRLFRLAKYEQQQLRDRNIQHQKLRHHHTPGESVDDYEFAWIVKRAAAGVVPSAACKHRGARSLVGFDVGDSIDQIGADSNDGESKQAGVAQLTTGNTYRSRVGTNTVDFNERIEKYLHPKKKDGSAGSHGGFQQESEQEKARKAQLLSLCGLVATPTLENLSEEERRMLEEFLKERSQDVLDSGERYPCDCCGPQATIAAETSHRAATYYDLLFAHRKNESFTVQFDLAHCLPRFLLHYKFHKQLYDCLDASEKLDLVKAAVDITLSYSLGLCTLQLPFGRYRTNAYPSFFAYILVPEHAKYLEIFDCSNPQADGTGNKHKKNSCIVPNWPDKAYMTEFWTYSIESTNTSDKDPRLATKLYEKNVLRKLEIVKMPELQVTRTKPSSELAFSKQRAHPRLGDFELFEDFALVVHNELSMLGFGSVSHPTHATNAQPDLEFLNRLLQAMCNYVRRFVNTKERRLSGKEDLSCTVNVSLHHSYAFKGHQRVYGFIGFPKASTYWASLLEQQQQNAAIAETAVTHADIRQMRAASRTSAGGSEAAGQVTVPATKDVSEATTVTETFADRAEIEAAAAKLKAALGGAVDENLKSCSVQ